MEGSQAQKNAIKRLVVRRIIEEFLCSCLPGFRLLSCGLMETDKFVESNCLCVFQTCQGFSKSIFAGLPEDNLKNIHIHRSVQQFANRESIAASPEHQGRVYCISQGAVGVFRRPGQGLPERLLRILGPGDFFGGFNLLPKDFTFKVDLVSMGSSSLCYLSPDVFNDLIENSPALNRSVLCRLYGTLVNLEDLHSDFKFLPVSARVAATLVKLANGFGTKTPRGIFLNLKISRKEIGDLAGTVVESVVRALNDLEENKFITTEGRRIYVQDPEKLHQSRVLSVA